MGAPKPRNNYIDKTVARPSQVNENEIELWTILNGNVDWENIRSNLINSAGGFVQLDANALIPQELIPLLDLSKIPDVLTGKTLDIGATQTLKHNGVEIITTTGKVKHAVYG